MGLMPRPDPTLVRSRREAGAARTLAAFQAAFARDAALSTALTQRGLQIAAFNLMAGAVGSVALEDDAVTQAKIAAAAVLASELGVTAGTVTNLRALVPDSLGTINTLGITGATTLASAASATATIGSGNSAVVNLAGGSSAALGAFGATAVTQQARGGTTTNNVTAGGTTDTIANFTDLTTYANDAAAIRNNFYQIARVLNQLDTALRNYGLLT